MKIASKVVFWFLTAIFAFIIINLTIGLIKYKSLNNYIDHLDQKDWSKTVSQISISNPKSILNIFYWDLDFSKQAEQTEQILDTLDLIDDKEILETWNNEFDPYDPDFQDEFNSFFGGQDSSTENINTDVEAGFIVDPDEELVTDSQWSKTVGQELLEKFSQ